MKGWWGHNPSTRFAMPSEHDAIRGAGGYQQSNPSAILAVTLLGSLQLFDEAGGIDAIRAKSVKLTAYLESCLRGSKHFVEVGQARTGTAFTIITPREAEARGTQLSLFFLGGESVMTAVDVGMKKRGVIGDERKPFVLRLSPVPLYNTYEDCAKAAWALEEILDGIAS